MKTNKEKEKVVALATKLDKSVLAQFRGIARVEYCSISALGRKAIDLLGQAYEKQVLPKTLMQRVPTPKDAVGITIRVDGLQAERLRRLATDSNETLSYLLRSAIHHFIFAYEGAEVKSSMTEFLELPQERIRVTIEVDEKVMEELTTIALERNTPMHLLIGNALNLFTMFHTTEVLTEGIRETQAFINLLALILPLPEERPGKTLEEVVRRHVIGSQNKREGKHPEKVSDTREEKEDESREKALE